MPLLDQISIGSVGSYRKALRSGTIGAGLTGGSIVYAFQWKPVIAAGKAVLLVPRRIAISLGDLAGFTAGFFDIDAYFARPYTTIDATGAGTTGTFTGNNAKMRTSYPLSNGAACVIAGTGALSGGTSTLDTDPFASASISVAATAGTPPNPTPLELYRVATGIPGDAPLVFDGTTNPEGFVLKATVPATGTWQISVEVSWDEFLAN
jgi:hypothetical protein